MIFKQTGVSSLGYPEDSTSQPARVPDYVKWHCKAMYLSRILHLMHYRWSRVSPTSLFGFILLALAIVNASPTHSGTIKIAVTRVRGPGRAKALYNTELGKRHDGIIVVDQEDGFYAAFIRTSTKYIYKLMVDTGSSYTWVGNNAANPYVPGFGSEATGQRVKLLYDGGAISFTGMTYSDIITLQDILTINPQSIGVSDRSGVFDPKDYDGILGLGPTVLNTHISEDGNPIPPISTVVDNLYIQGTIGHAVLGIYFMPYNDGDRGLLSFGNYDDTVLLSGMNYVPVTNTFPVSKYWGVDASVTYRGIYILNPTSGIVDTGSSLIKIESDAFLIYISETGATLNSGDWYTLTEDKYNNLGILSFVIGDQHYDLSPNAQIFPRASLEADIYLIIDEQPRVYGSIQGFTLGCPFLERYYVVLNSSSSQIGFASTLYTYSMTN
ncbi:hypothetical protein ID866_10178 [Astraeus odoratus]|nr:hypothetical protein ID866_10178 [Astraeus odoratus]